MPPIIIRNEPLASYTTLGVGGDADYFACVSTTQELKDVLIWAKENNQKITVLGGGSNVLIGDNGIHGLVLHPTFKDITYEENGDDVLVTAGAGLLLDGLVEELVFKNLWGLENLSSIPGTVGAVPIQNVGAYGVEAEEVISSVRAFDTESLASKTFTNQECKFAYRDSIFKKKENRKYIVTRVVFKVSKIPQPNILYKNLQEFLKGNKNPSIQEVREAVQTIRSAKFPDRKKVGTAGSFFKNPVISKEHFQNIQHEYPDIPGYAVDDTSIKVPLGWILDHVCNLRGYTEGDVGLHKKQALVLVCKKGISSELIDNFAKKISNIVLKKTGISITREVTSL